ncbi:putative heat shock protein hsp98 [Erysiphe pulchra]|uniref:Putative heat shock protein hsp98 n=1 Tax=Erysiphe pulchra TaxID=225359 RepID=A0A2S4PL93_9PEZI|nr:putative heat shock protein hsp98 [Erysiphe pulchra]
MATPSMNFTDRATKALADSMSLAETNAHSQVQPIHLALSLLDPPRDESGDSSSSQSMFRQVVERARGDAQAFQRALSKAVVRLPTHEQQKTQKDSFIAVDHLIIALTDDSMVQQALKEGNVVNMKVIKDAVSQVRGTKRVDTKTADTEEDFENLKKFTIDMTSMAREGKIDPVIGRDGEIRRVVRILSRRTKNNPVLIGEPGVGKTTVVEGLALRIVNNDVPDNLAACKLLSLDVGSLVAGSKYRGEFEERLKGLLKEVEDSKEFIVLFVDEMHLLMGAGSVGEGGMDAANLLKPMLARGQLHCIGATTLSEYRKYIEKDAAFERRFQQVLVNEPSVTETISILRGLKDKYEVYHGITINDGAIVAAATLAARYLTQRRLPDSAVDLIDEAAAAVRTERESLPEALDKLNRKAQQLKIEIHALSREKDEASKARLAQAREDASNVEEELRPLREKYESERARGKAIQEAKIKLEQLKVKKDDATRVGDDARAADLQYYAIPEQEKYIKALEREKAAADAALSSSGNPDSSGSLITDIVGPEQINEIVARATGIPVNRLKTTEKEKLLQMEKVLAKIVVGQKEAVQAVSDKIRLQRAGLSNPNQPPSFLFCGPSGTGKTLLTKALAEFLFDDPKAMIRLDMSEYQERHTVSRMIGAPPGYIGHDAGGQLTEALRRKPFSILLFDEVEKAAKEVLTILLQLMDDGRITDGQGRIVDARNCIVVMTSNIGAQYLQRPTTKQGKIDDTTKALVRKSIEDYFLPEFINRISAVIIFNRLSKSEIRKIVELRLDEVQNRLTNNGKDVKVECTPEVKEWLGSAGYHPSYGARPLARLIESEVLNRLAVLILRGSIKDGEVARVVLENGKVKVLANHEVIEEVSSEEEMEVDDDVVEITNADDMDLYE